MAEYIACRSCIEPDCTGCNMLALETALKNGLFEGLKDCNKHIQITAEVAPVKLGAWIDHQLGQWIYAECSECKTVHDVKSNFCPHCGAKMVLGVITND